LQSLISADDASDYEQRLVQVVSAALPRESHHPVGELFGQHVVFDDVAIEGSFPDSVLTIHVRDPARPHCLFATSWHLWTRRPDGQIEPPTSPPEQYGAVCAEEAEQFLTVGLPAECAEGELTRVTTRNRVLDPPYFAARVLAAFRQRVHERVTEAHFGGRPSRCWARQVYLDGEYPRQRLVALLEAEHRPECTFGFRWPLWDGDGRPDHEKDWPTPEEQAWFAAVHLEEDLGAAGYGLPTDCAQTQITWFR
jgi:hypothetical protein